MAEPQAEHLTSAQPRRPRGLVIICMVLLVVCLVSWGLSFALGVAIVRVHTTPKGGKTLEDGRYIAPTLNLSEYDMLMLSRGNVVVAAGAVTAADPNRPVGPDGWSLALDKPEAFIPVPLSKPTTLPVAIMGAGDQNLTYHLGQRWLPPGSEFTIPCWMLVIATAILLGLSVYRAARIEQSTSAEPQ